MTREKLKKYLQENEAVFGYNGDREILLQAWYEVFKEADTEEFKKAFYKAIETEEFFIKPAVIIKLIKKNKHPTVAEAWKICNKLLNKHIQRDEIMAIKDKHPIIYEIWEDNKFALNSEYKGRTLFKELYKEAIYG